jgi:membrane protein
MKAAKTTGFLKETFQEFGRDKVMRWAAATAYYAVFSLAPMLVIAIALAGVFLGDEAARGEVVDQLSGTMGPQAAEAVQNMIRSANEGGGGLIASLLSIAALLFGASALFLTLKDGLNNIFNVPEEKQSGGWKGMIRQRLIAFAMVLGMGILVLAAMIASSVLTRISEIAGGVLPSTEVLLQVANFVVITILFGLVFGALLRYLPATNVPWHIALRGGFITAVLFSVGKFLIALYLSHKGVQSSYGAAGGLVLVMLWVYYSATIFFLGAEITKVYARRHGEAVEPERRESRAVRLQEA